MLQSDWPGHCTVPPSAVNVQWFSVVDKMSTFSRRSEVLKEHIKQKDS